MSIAVTCPACTRTFRVKDKYAGKFGSCCYCSSAVRVPRIEIESEDSFDVLLDDVDRVNGSPGASLLNSVEIVRCPSCERRNLGGVQTCAHCGSLLR